jgi:hypothetical protein
MFKGRFPTFSLVTLDDKWISLSLEMTFWMLMDVVIVNPIHNSYGVANINNDNTCNYLGEDMITH